MNPVDKDNVKQILEIVSGEQAYTRAQVEQVYISCGKNMEATLDKFFSGQVNVPSEKIVVEVKEKQQP